MAERDRKPERKTVGPLASVGFLLAALCFALAGVSMFVLRSGPLVLLFLYSGVGMVALTFIGALVGLFVRRRKCTPPDADT